ncbi:MAG: copper amine oxidase N-terminal domain-containing protein [Eubacteriales bacterium]|nr:copper amine oxidase N-terminal domain-containing protein [Eubacteriales bacterium]
MKKIIKTTICALTIASVLCSSMTVLGQKAYMQLDSITVMKNDDFVSGTNILYNDRTYVPLREIAESLGCKVDWDGATNTATITGQATSEGVNLQPTYYEQEYKDLKNAFDMNSAFAGDDITKKLLEQKFAGDVAGLDARYRAEARAKQTPAVELDVEFDSINVIVNGTKIQESNILYNDRTYVPFRAVFETLGCEVLWHDVTQTATIKGKLVIEEIYTSFEEEYATLCEQYKPRISEQRDLGKQKYEDVLKQSADRTGGQVKGQEDEANAEAEPFYKQAEALLGEFVTKVNNLKTKYGFNGEVPMDPTIEE